MSMSKRDYEMMACQFATAGGDRETLGRLVDRFCDVLAEQNPRFNAGLFRSACGFPVQVQGGE